MPRGTYLTEKEQGQILAYKNKHLNVSEIAEVLGRSRKVVSNFLKNSENYGKNKKGGPKKKLSSTSKRYVLKTASNSKISCAKLAHMIPTPVSRTTVWRVLKESSHICRRKMMKGPRLLDHHKRARIDYAEKNLRRNWSQVIFSDEKKWNLDGPDGYNGYWRDLRKEPQVFSKRNFGGGSVMTWGAFCEQGTLELQFVSSWMNSADYIQVLQCSLMPYLRQTLREPYVFQQDNARIHTSRQTKSFLSDQNVEMMDWPACSPDLNPIENVWGVLARRVYNNNNTYQSVEQLKIAIIREWEQLEDSFLSNLVHSMDKRLIECLRKNGGATSY